VNVAITPNPVMEAKSTLARRSGIDKSGVNPCITPTDLRASTLSDIRRTSNEAFDHRTTQQTTGSGLGDLAHDLGANLGKVIQAAATSACCKH
jgi:hypothetical protein